MELIRAYWYMHPGEFQAAINLQDKKRGALNGWWVTQDGIKLKAHMMRDTHLMNCISMVEKKADFPIRTYAMHHIQNRVKELPTSHEKKMVQRVRQQVTYINLVREAHKRGLIQDEIL